MREKDQQSFDDRVAQGFRVILLAEDDVIVRNVLLLALRQTDYAVLVAVDGQEALNLSRAFEGDIALLITDMEMPRMPGDELGERIMRDRPGIRILQISGRGAEEFAGRNLSLAFLQKPFRMNAFLSKVQDVMCAPAGVIRDISSSAP